MITNFKLFENMENNYIKLKGKIVFDPQDKTRKHSNQASWKKIAMIMFEGDICEYYAQFVDKRYNLKLNKPLRGAHISFINDSLRDIKTGLNISSEQEAQKQWEILKEKWDGVEVEVSLDPDIRSDGDHWWLVVPEEKRDDIHKIRAEIGLERPFFGLHLQIGHANEKNINHSKYIVNLVSKYKGEYN
jgi:hypothetical protein